MTLLTPNRSLGAALISVYLALRYFRLFLPNGGCYTVTLRFFMDSAQRILNALGPADWWSTPNFWMFVYLLNALAFFAFAIPAVIAVALLRKSEPRRLAVGLLSAAVGYDLLILVIWPTPCVLS